MQAQPRAISGVGGQPSNNPFASASLYVGDLSSEVTEATLFELFNAVGPVASIRVCRDATTRRSLGYAYVNFHSVQDAERALDTMNFTNIRGKQCRIMWSQRDPRLRQSGKGNIFVKNLHESIDNKTLYDTFSVFGNILSCKVVIDKDTQKSRGYGYVHYVDDKSAKKAIEGVNGMTISDRQVHAELFKPREERIKSFKYTNVYVKYIPKSWTEAALRKVFQDATGGTITKAYLWRHDYGVSACLNFADSDQAKLAVEKLNGKETRSFEIPKDLLEEEEEKQDDDDDDGDHEAEEKKDEPQETPDDENKTEAAPKDTEESKEKEVGQPKLVASKPEAKPEAALPTKLYVARAQKRKERKEYLQRQKRGRGGFGGRRSYSGANLYVKNLSPDVDDKKLLEMFGNFGNITSAKVMRDASGKSRGFGFVAFDKKEAATRAHHEMTNTLHHGKPLYVARAQTKAFRQNFIMKQLRNKRIRNQNQGGGGNYGPNRNQMGGPAQFGGGNQQRFGGPNQPYGGPPQQAPQQYGGPQPPQQQPPYQRGPAPQQMQFGQPMGGMPAQQFGAAMGGIQAPMGQIPYQQLQRAQQQAQVQQMIAAQQQAAQLRQLQAAQAQINPAQLAQQQQQLQQTMSSIQQQAVAQSSMQMSSIQQQAAGRSQSMGQAGQSQPAQSMQSGPQSTSMYASVPRSGLTASQQMGVAAVSGIASQPHQSSVPTGQHSVSQISAGQTSAPMLEVNPLTSEMLKDAKPAEKKRLIGERLFPKIQVVEPRLAGKITGMLLEMDNTELLVLLSDQRALMNKINEALAVLKDHQQKQSQQNPQSNKNLSAGNTGSAQNH